MTPEIAIPKLGPGLLRRCLGKKYVAALAAAGACVRWIGPEDLDAALQCDGLLIPGGDDIDPSLYGQTKTQKCGKQNPLRDRLDPALLQMFLPTGKPVLGVCRGMQMLNVFLGGTLHQDIHDQQSLCHQNFPARGKGVHDVSVADNSRLRSIVGSARIRVNSLHHQTVDVPGAGLTVTARSDDGFAEAIELEEHPFCMGLQWHPELMSRHAQEQHEILCAFTASCKR